MNTRCTKIIVALCLPWLCGCDRMLVQQDDRDVEHVALDSRADWSPSSDWAAAGDLDPGDTGAEDEYGPVSDASTDYGVWDTVADTAEDTFSTADAILDLLSDPIPDTMIATDVIEDDMDEEEMQEDVLDDASSTSDGAGGGGSPDAPSLDEPYVVYLSADDSNSQASPVYARKLMELGRRVPWWSIRVYEFLNYYDMGYPASAPGTLGVSAQFRAVDESAGLYALQVGVHGSALDNASRRPVNLTLVLDTSGSMSGTPIELEKEAMRAIAASLKYGDVVSMVEWDSVRTARLSGHRVTGPNDVTLMYNIEDLESGGGTDLHAGLSMGYDLARENYSQGIMNRVILVSDGQANAGITDIDIIAENANDAEGEAIYLVGVGVGSGYNDTLMDEVTDAGRGAYIFIDSQAEAWKMFSERFVQTVEVEAYEVAVELSLPGVFRIEEFHGEEYSTVEKEVTPQHLAPNDAMVFHQLLLASDPGAVWADDMLTVRASWLDGPGGVERSASYSRPLQTLIWADARQMRKADAIVVYAQALMRISHSLASNDWDEAHETCVLAQGIVDASAYALYDDDLMEISSLLEGYCELIETHSLGYTSY